MTARSMLQVSAKPPFLTEMPFYIHDSGDKYISERIRRTGVWEPFESRVLLSLLAPGDQVLDVGANIGWYSVSAGRRVGPSGHVFAFEPDATNFRLLCANVQTAALKCVSAERMALGRASGSAAIVHSKDNQGDHRLNAFAGGEVESRVGERVLVVAIDDYLAKALDFAVDRLRVIKIDVQGFEREVLLGAKRLLAQLPTRTIVFLEFDPQLLLENDAGACADLIDLMESMQRRIFRICRPVWRVKRMAIDALRAAAQAGKSESADLILLHPDHLQDLRRALPWVPRLLSSSELR